ncbi:sporulation protein [Virgibacillus phasianinus]|uniref:Sporulation protein n=1 Tax=Virgibacillus phasianinus TaxID=2017483 RepID=A0A220U8E4_9BACI|nr:YtrH family sporulation protein [Virgibacillus phasianinus]ASK64408.1 sporulation protein [Virgibacillus phasianinus]
MEERFFASFIHCYFIAFGVIIGGTIIGSIGHFMTGDAPVASITRLARSLRIWAIVAAIGGTFDAIANFERGLDGSSIDVFKQVLLIVAAMGGVKSAILILTWAIQQEIE